METVRIGIAVKDREYRNALLRGLSRESRDFQFVALDGGKSSCDVSECQIVIKEPEICLESSSHQGGSNIADRNAPSWKPSAEPLVIDLTYHELYDMGCRGRREIFRYEDAAVFIGKIIYYYDEDRGIDLYFHGRTKCRKVVFSSPKGGCGTTTAALTSARILKYRFGMKTLFISLCPLDGSRKYMESGDGGNMLALLYHLNVGDNVPLCKFISSSDGVDHFRGEENNRAASEMTVSEMKRLIKLIDEMGVYSYVVFDVGNHLSSLAEFLIDEADVRVSVRIRGSEISEEEVRRQMIRVIDFDDEREKDGSSKRGEVSLTYEPGAFIAEDKKTLIDVRGRYGRDVSMLAERIVSYAE